MTLDEIVLHDFGVYGGRQSATLTPESARQPIVLFGGLNGGGKTTLLDALQLCLFGQAARCSNRKGLAYDEYLRRGIHKGSATPEAALELAFRHTADGSEQQIRLHRSWRATNSGCREAFEVIRNGSPDALATEHWAELVEDYLPARIAPLFLFDGENVAAYADLEEAPALIATAIHNLLGLDIVERLGSDLAGFERRKRGEMRTPEAGKEIEELRSSIATLESERAELVRERASAANLIDRRTAELASAEDRYRREGGAVYERRAELEAAVARAEQRLIALRQGLLAQAAATAPLMLVRGLVRSSAERAKAEDAAKRNGEAAAVASEEHDAILALPSFKALPAVHRKSLAAALQLRKSTREGAANIPIALALDAMTFSLVTSLDDANLDRDWVQSAALLREEREATVVADQAREALSAAPDEEAVAPLLAARDSAKAAVERLRLEEAARDGETQRIDRALSQARERKGRLDEADAKQRFEQDDLGRMLRHSAKVRGTLGRFKEAVIERHVARIEAMVCTSFQQLVRKRGLIDSVRIDPRTFALELRGCDGHVLGPDRLSAGERQLLAISILWGLGRSAGRPLPTVIDTPLGRLDSIHRTHLVQRYFPQASHQVLLLSTDEEIRGAHYRELMPAVGRSYHLRFDERASRTVIEPGYLKERADAH